jgi:two-component system, chemotaxis family, chemotaxis protein CheY
MLPIARALARLGTVDSPLGGNRSRPRAAGRPLAYTLRSRVELMPQILVVEDDDAIRGLVSDVLRDDGYDVREAANGLEGLAQLHAERPDLIVLDLMMPIMDGWTFVEQCRRKPDCGDVPIVVTSASHDLPRTAERLRSYGVRTCLAKPFDVDGLLALVERYAPSRPAA